jgi:hypothetical protein
MIDLRKQNKPWLTTMDYFMKQRRGETALGVTSDHEVQPGDTKQTLESSLKVLM